MSKLVIFFCVVSLLLMGARVYAQQKNSKAVKSVPSLQKLQRPAQSNPVINSEAVTKYAPYNFMFDFQSMPQQVQQRIAKNKRNGVTLSEGVHKIYKIHYRSCHTVEQARSTFSFLKTSFSPIGIEMITDGLINLTVNPDVSSVSLKEAIQIQGITVNFISETYIVQ